MSNNVLLERYKEIVESYIRAKDNNKPHMMKAAFIDSAILEMKVNKGEISFPAKSDGIDEITRVLVRNFSQTYENVYTYCFSESIEAQKNALSCKWLVGMSERDSGDVRIGCGRYDWVFDSENQYLASSLVITIEQMLTFDSKDTDQLMGWAGKQTHPFCETKVVLDNMPNLEPLKAIRDYIA